MSAQGSVAPVGFGGLGSLAGVDPPAITADAPDDFRVGIASRWAEYVGSQSRSMRVLKTIGDLLIAKQAQGGGPTFERWVAENCPFKVRMARNYMSLAAHWREDFACRASLSVCLREIERGNPKKLVNVAEQPVGLTEADHQALAEVLLKKGVEVDIDTLIDSLEAIGFSQSQIRAKVRSLTRVKEESPAETIKRLEHALALKEAELAASKGEAAKKRNR